jgi:predicted esterase
MWPGCVVSGWALFPVDMEKHLEFAIKAPYYTLNELTDKTENIWLATHGYGQLAQYFLKKFEQLDPEKNFIIAPQGLSKYYLEGVTGRVGASWMTREDRLTEIENQHRMIKAIWQTEVGNPGKRQVIFLGFSQGVPAVIRFAAFTRTPFQKLVLWAGGFPPDLPESAFAYLTGNEKVMYFCGHDDPYHSPGMYEKQRELILANMHIEPAVTFFDGGHTVVPELLQGILNR